MASAVEAAPLGLAGRCFDGADPAQGRERRFAVEPVGVVAGRDQERGGRVGADAADVQQLRCGGLDRGGDASPQIVNLGLEVVDLAVKVEQRVDGGRTDVVVAVIGAGGQLGAVSDELSGAQGVEGVTQRRVGGDQHCFELVYRLDPGLDRGVLRGL